MNGSEAEAGPSRHRRPTTPPARPSSDQSSSNRRPASPETALAGREERERERARGAAHVSADGEDQRMSPGPTTETGRSGTSADSSGAPPRLDLAKYHTPSLLRLLANLLQQIASANDQIRPELDEYEEDEASHTASDEADGAAKSVGTREGEGDRQGQSTSSAAETSSSANTSRAGSRASSQSRSTAKRPHPSPTTALFPHSSTPSASTPRPPSASDPHPTSLYSQPANSLFSASKTSLLHPASLLSFHARHVPSISIEAYLLRILKYCPTTNEVFLSLLVYFDRMSKLGTAQGLGGESVDPTGQGKGRRGTRGFAIDSFNVHRLVIAGVTVASKFFSDVFYTNSRYAKVGGLPPSELNQLELQFLLLNDFRLAIPIEEMQRYGDRLLMYSENKEQMSTGLGEAVPAARAASSESMQAGREQGGEQDERRHANTVVSEATVTPTPGISSTGGTAVVKGASEAMEVDEDEVPSRAAEAERSHEPKVAIKPVVSTTLKTQTAPASQTSFGTHPNTSTGISRAISTQRSDPPERAERAERADLSAGLGGGHALRWSGPTEGIVSGSN